METRTQTQETVRNLLNRIIDFNRDKHREYSELGFNIQRDYSLDDYVDMLSYMDNCGNNLYNNEEAINELSDADLLKLEQALKYTTEFIGLSTQNIQWGTDYRAIEADFPTFDYFNFPNPLEFLLYLIDPRGRHIRQVRNSFPMLSPSEQMDYLRTKYEEGMRKNGRARGRDAEHLRNLRSQMKLEGLFNINGRFMNVELRDFLNLNDDGTPYYSWQDVHSTSWREIPSIGSQEHQITAPNTRVIVRRTPLPNGTLYEESVYNRLNAKFCHDDGREVVFAYRNTNDGILITDYPDKGTYNYADDRGNDFVLLTETIIPPMPHYFYDIQPYNRLIEEKLQNEDDFRRNMEIWIIVNGGKKYNESIQVNSYYWQYDYDIPILIK